LNYTAKIIFSSLFQAQVQNNSSPKQFTSSICVSYYTIRMIRSGEAATRTANLSHRTYSSHF